jgi:alcohol dehydrogenase
MRAQVIQGHGAIEDIRFEPNWPDPQPGPTDVVLRVGACTLNYHDLFTLRGMPGIKLNMPLIMGIDVAGEVVALGSDVGGWTPGDRVVVDPINRKLGKLLGENSSKWMRRNSSVCRTTCPSTTRRLCLSRTAPPIG